MLEDIFREYDIRGIIGTQLNQATIKAIGCALAKVLKEKKVKTLSIGYDARLSAKEILEWLVSGLHTTHLEIFDIGLVPTPVGYFSVFTKEFDANIMITGSHNPKEYNGFKITIATDSFFGKDLQKLGKEVSLMLQNDPNSEKIPTNTKITKFDIASKYENFFIENFSHLKNFNLAFVCDFANGAGGIIAKNIIQKLNLNAKLLFVNPDGNFPNHHPDPSVEENLSNLKEELKNDEFKIAFGFDGDCDRICVLNKNRIIKGDELAYLYALNMKNPRVLGEVKCSQNMYDEINKIGNAFMGKTGHSNIKKAMKELNIDLAAEVSGHIFFKERYFGFDDAIYAMFRALELLYLGFDFEKELNKLPKLYSTDEIKIHTNENEKFIIIQKLKDKLSTANLPIILDVIDIDGIRVRFATGWALVRASNTTPVIVTRYEAKTQQDLKNLQNLFENLINEVKKEL